MKVKLKPIISSINIPTVIKTAVLPNEISETLFIATQVGEIFYIKNHIARTFLDIRSQVIELENKAYEERGLLGLAFHPNFKYNGLFYIHYSLADSKGPGALDKSYKPNPCNKENLIWENREEKYDHIDTIEEWIYKNNDTKKIRTILNLRRPFSNHNGFNSLNFSPETNKLVLTTGDGGFGYDPFNLSQNNMEIAGKIIEIDINKNTFINNPPPSSRFDELPIPVQQTLSVIAKGVRNISGIEYLKVHNNYRKYIINVGQQMVESIFSFNNYNSIPVINLNNNIKNIINFGWRGWEGNLPTLIKNTCSNNADLNEYLIAYYDEAIDLSTKRILPIISYYHIDIRPNKFEGTAITGAKPYIGIDIPELIGSIVFTDLENKNNSKGVLAYSKIIDNYKLNDFNIIDVDYDFKLNSTHYVGLGSNLNHTKLYLGVYGDVKKPYQGYVFEIIPSN